ncbi:MAG: hypothetical protein L0H96_02145 [Humibacillus sp.]|nr:hypothetical protein [Humibacillus sp.]MDN5775694.1 hypothetical protein [Humibacillus sp.]
MTTHIGKKLGTNPLLLMPPTRRRRTTVCERLTGAHQFIAYAQQLRIRNELWEDRNVKATMNAGSQARTHPGGDSPVTRLATLQHTLMGGRGPGASDEEVAGHTRDRPWLGAVPAPVERALVQRQAEHLRAGEPIVNELVLRTERSRALRAAILGAVVALVIRAVTVRGARSRRDRHD